MNDSPRGLAPSSLEMLRQIDLVLQREELQSALVAALRGLLPHVCQQANLSVVDGDGGSSLITDVEHEARQWHQNHRPSALGISVQVARASFQRVPEPADAFGGSPTLTTTPRCAIHLIMNPNHNKALGLVAGVLLLTAACSDGSTESVTSSDPAVANYAVNASVPDPDGSETSYVAIVASLSAEERIDYTKVLPVPGGSGIFGPDNGGYFMIGRDDEPTIQRYDVAPDGTFNAGGKFSLQNLGISSAWAGSDWGYIYSDTIAYYVNPFGLNVVEFNPTDMTLTRLIDNPGLVLDEDPDGALWEQGHGRPARVGDRIFMPAVYRNNDTDTAYPHSAVAVLDMATGEVTYTKDDRCGPTIGNSEGPDGYLYLSSWLWRYGMVGRPAAPVACLLRVNTTTGEFDPDFYVDTKNTLGGGREISSVVFNTQGVPYSVVFHPELFPITDETASWEPGEGANWGWIKLDSNFREPGIEIDADLVGANIKTYKVAGQVHINVDVAEDVNTATLYSLEADGLHQELVMSGRSWGVVKLR